MEISMKFFCQDLTNYIIKRKLLLLFSSVFNNTITYIMILSINIVSKHQQNYSGIQKSILYDNIILVLTELTAELPKNILYL